jgi:hypothetical protein
VSVAKQGKSVATVTVKVQNTSSATTITASSASTTNVSVSPGSASVSAGGSASFTIKSLKNNAGFIYQVKFKTTNCGEVIVPVTVTVN